PCFFFSFSRRRRRHAKKEKRVFRGHPEARQGRCAPCTLALVSCWYQHEHSLGVFLDHAALEGHGMMFDVEPGFDEVRVMLAGGMARLPGCVPGEGGFRVSKVDNLAVGRHRDDSLW